VSVRLVRHTPKLPVPAALAVVRRPLHSDAQAASVHGRQGWHAAELHVSARSALDRCPLHRQRQACAEAAADPCAQATENGTQVPCRLCWPLAALSSPKTPAAREVPAGQHWHVAQVRSRRQMSGCSRAATAHDV
jgi:hypothetical protein